MISANVETLLDKWMNDESFREALRRDPETAVRAAGVTLNDEESAALRAIDWSLSDDALAERASKNW